MARAELLSKGIFFATEAPSRALLEVRLIGFVSCVPTGLGPASPTNFVAGNPTEVPVALGGFAKGGPALDRLFVCAPVEERCPERGRHDGAALDTPS